MPFFAGNKVSNAIWQARDDATAAAITPTASYSARDKFIRAKYQHKLFLAVSSPWQDSLNTGDSRMVYQAALTEACDEDDVQAGMRALVYGAGVDGPVTIMAGPDTANEDIEDGSILEYAVEMGAIGCVTLLVLNGATLTAFRGSAQPPVNFQHSESLLTVEEVAVQVNAALSNADSGSCLSCEGFDAAHSHTDGIHSDSPPPESSNSPCDSQQELFAVTSEAVSYLSPPVRDIPMPPAADATNAAGLGRQNGKTAATAYVRRKADLSNRGK